VPIIAAFVVVHCVGRSAAIRASNAALRGHRRRNQLPSAGRRIRRSILRLSAVDRRHGLPRSALPHVTAPSWPKVAGRAPAGEYIHRPAWAETDEPPTLISSDALVRTIAAVASRMERIARASEDSPNRRLSRRWSPDWDASDPSAIGDPTGGSTSRA
jgi:hypothetical protein